MIDRNAMLAGLLLVAVYVTGLVSGVVVLRLVEPEGPSAWPEPWARPMRPAPGTGPLNGRPEPGFSVGVLAQRLDLSPDQVVAVDEIVERRRDAMTGLMSSLRPAMEAEFARMDAEIRAVLTDEQRAAFDEFIDARFESFGGRNPFGDRLRPSDIPRFR